ncbi:MAG TPA: lysine 5,6-aminomutase subunit alpha, partial [Verrucomicrobiae bacterium]|nr:lysine 5,6-aminomutase subunit alpha [Verrucomicrobiae bacterium]
MNGKLNLDPGTIKRGRELANLIVEPVQREIETKTTTAVERSVLRLVGIDGVDEAGVPLVNIFVEQLHRAGVLGKGVMFWLVNAMLQLELTPQQIAEGVAGKGIGLTNLPHSTRSKIEAKAQDLAEQALQK